MEVCRYNLNHQESIGKIGQEVPVAHQLVPDEVYRGSYNYSETVVMGEAHHNYRRGFALGGERFLPNLPMHSPIGDRRFPLVH